VAFCARRFAARIEDGNLALSCAAKEELATPNVWVANLWYMAARAQAAKPCQRPLPSGTDK